MKFPPRIGYSQLGADSKCCSFDRLSLRIQDLTVHGVLKKAPGERRSRRSGSQTVVGVSGCVSGVPHLAERRDIRGSVELDPMWQLKMQAYNDDLL